METVKYPGFLEVWNGLTYRRTTFSFTIVQGNNRSITKVIKEIRNCLFIRSKEGSLEGYQIRSIQISSEQGMA
jgi:hypothetical protein